MEVEGTTRWQAVLGKSHSKREWRQNEAGGGGQFSVRVKVSVGGGGVEHIMAGCSR